MLNCVRYILKFFVGAERSAQPPSNVQLRENPLRASVDLSVIEISIDPPLLDAGVAEHPYCGKTVGIDFACVCLQFGWTPLINGVIPL